MLWYEQHWRINYLIVIMGLIIPSIILITSMAIEIYIYILLF